MVKGAAGFRFFSFVSRPVTFQANDLRTYLSVNGKCGWPFRDGDYQPYEGYSGMISVKASTTQRPGVVDMNVQPIISEEDFYPGCWARATVTVWPYDVESLGVKFTLQNVQKVRDDARLGGAVSNAEDDFTPVSGADDPANYGATGTGDYGL